MEFSKVLRRAWEITWRYKILWVFGLILALAGGSGGAGGGRGGTGMRWTMPGPERFDLRWGVVALVLVLLALLLGLLLAALTIIARGALVDGVRQAEDEGQVSGSRAWKKGVSRFWSLLGIYLLAFLVILVLVVPILALIGVGIWVGAVGGQRMGMMAVPFVCGALLLAIPLLIVGIVLNLISVYAERACILGGLGSVESLKKGWETLMHNIGETLIVGVVMLLINVVISAIFFGGIVTMALPAVALWNTTRNVWITAAPLCAFGSLFVLLALAVGAVAQTFTSAVWTLTYRQLEEPRAQ